MAFAKITKGWHLLFVGSNGDPCFGLEATALCDPKESYSGGKQHVWKVNDCTFLNNKISFMDSFGVTEAEYNELEIDLKSRLNKKYVLVNKYGKIRFCAKETDQEAD